MIIKNNQLQTHVIINLIILTNGCALVLPSLSGLLWLHVVITCPPPPHVHSEMPTSVNSSHPDMTGYQVMTVKKHISHSPLTSYWAMSDDIHDNKRKRPGAKNKSSLHVFVFTNMAGIYLQIVCIILYSHKLMV